MSSSEEKGGNDYESMKNSDSDYEEEIVNPISCIGGCGRKEAKWFTPPGKTVTTCTYCEYCYKTFVRGVEFNAEEYIEHKAKYCYCDYENFHGKNLMTPFIEKSSYYSGGIIDVPIEELCLFYRDKTREAQVVTFPTDEYDNMMLFENTIPATFGKGTDSVLDENYRKAHTLSIMDFALNMDITDYVTDDIHTKLMCHTENIYAEKYKLNVYGQGGFFNEHRDTPSSPDMFGSLVICLPAQFTGGALVLRKNEHTHRFDWDQNCDKIQWAAFFGDIIHNVEEVTSGHRITLTYKLYSSKPTKRQRTVTGTVEVDSISNSEDVVEFKKAIDIFCQVGVEHKIGFGCKYMYTISESYGVNNHNPLEKLKGSDAIVYKLFDAIGMKPFIEAITFQEEEYEEEDIGELCYKCWNRMYREDNRSVECYRAKEGKRAYCMDCVNKDNSILKDDEGPYTLQTLFLCNTNQYGVFYWTKPNEEVNDGEEYGADHDRFFESNKDTYKDTDKEKIMWINDPHSGDSEVSGRGSFLYGNDPASMQEFYMSSVILGDVKGYMINTIHEIFKPHLSKDLRNYLVSFIY